MDHDREPHEPQTQEAGAASPPDHRAPTLLDEPPKPRPKPEKKHGSFLRELPVLILIAFGLAILIKTFVAQAFYIPSESMVPTLQKDDRVLVNKVVYRFREPRRGEIIVFIAEHGDEAKTFWGKVRSFLFEGLGVVTPKERDFIKRVIGLPGETVQIDAKGRVSITPADGGERFRLDEPYVNMLEEEPMPPTKVPEGEYFVSGDNRPNSTDSRGGLGTIKREDIIGKAFLMIWPPRRIGFFHTPSYGPAASALVAAPALAGIVLIRRARRRR